MNRVFFAAAISVLGLAMLGCSPRSKPATEPAPETKAEAVPATPEAVPSQKLTKDQYVVIMSEVGCANIIDEASPDAEAIYQKHGLSYTAIREFRQNENPETMTQAAGEIAQRVVACH